MPIGMGVDPKRIMAELFGKSTGTSMGLGGSMHIFSKEHRFHGGHGIVGGQIPLGAGLAFGDKYNEEIMLLLYATWVMVQYVKVLYMKPLIWQCSGNYQWFFVVKITDMQWEHLLKEQQIILIFGN